MHLSPTVTVAFNCCQRRLVRCVRWALLTLVATLCLGAAQAAETVRVGTFDLSPLVFNDAQGQPQGLFVEVLRHIAQQEDWNLTFVHGSWADSLARLQGGEIDLLVSVSHTDERARTLDYSHDAIATDWGLLYKRAHSRLEGMNDLSGARVSVVRNGIYTGHFKRMAEQFDIKMQFLERDNYPQVIADVESGLSQAGIGSNIAGMALEGGHKVVRSGIVFAPIQVMFATRKGAHAELIAAIDRHVGALKADPESLYFKAVARWINARPASVLPAWALYAGGATLLVAMGLLLFVLLLRRQVRRKTADLRESQESLAITLHSIGDAVIATDPHGHVTRMNPTAERLSGWRLADALGRRLPEVFRIINADSREPVADPVQLVMAHGEVVGLANHTVLLAKDGTEYRIADSAAPIRNAEQTIVGVILVFNDVTDKYLAEEALRFTRFTVEAASDIIFWVTPDANFVDVNAAACRSLGYERQELLTLSLADVDPHFNRETWPQYFAELRQRGSLTFESEHRSRDGRLFPVEIVANYVKYGDQERNCAFVRDITERKRAEARLHLAASVFTHAREGIMITSAQGDIIDVNQAFTRITGYTRDEVLGKNPRLLASGRQDPAFYQAMWRDLLADGHWSGEVWNRRKDGGVFAEMITITAVFDEQGHASSYVALFSDITAIKAHQSQLEHIAHFDALTNLPNRLLLADRLQQAMVQAQRRGQQLAVAYLDLDGFKAINDRYGHPVGDQVLVALSDRMRHALREGDTLARIGGDEFVAVLIDLGDVTASAPMLNRLLLAAAEPVPLAGVLHQVSASIGVAFYLQAQDIEADQLLRQADQAMYQAKLAGKNRYHVFDATQESNLRVHHESLESIRMALERREFVLYYQPKVNMRFGHVVGAEALIRWQHPEKGLLAPAAFLPIIEDHALAVTVGEWVIDTALGQIELWRAAGLDLPVSVNIGARQLQQADFVDRLRSILAAHPSVSASRLELEVLETSALADIGQVSRLIEACAEIGVTFALDDFGTGYSSLTYLKRLRVGLLKIDQSFVRDMLQDPDDLAILQGVIGLAAAFRRQVIAEGVETVAHGTLLLQLGCELAQGYGIARPMPAAAMPAWVTTWQPEPAWCEMPWIGGGDSH